MIANPTTGKINVTQYEVECARSEDSTFVRPDGTLTAEGRLAVGRRRARNAEIPQIEEELAKWVPEFPVLSDQGAEHLGDLLKEWAKR